MALVKATAWRRASASDPSTAAPATKTFQSHVRISEAQATITLVGELDLAGAETMRSLGATTFGNPTVLSVVVDCSQITFCDSTALGVMVGWQNQSAHAGCKLSYREVSPPMMRVLTITKLDTVFEIVAS